MIDPRLLPGYCDLALLQAYTEVLNEACEHLPELNDLPIVGGITGSTGLASMVERTESSFNIFIPIGFVSRLRVLIPAISAYAREPVVHVSDAYFYGDYPQFKPARITTKTYPEEIGIFVADGWSKRAYWKVLDRVFEARAAKHDDSSLVQRLVLIGMMLSLFHEVAHVVLGHFAAIDALKRVDMEPSKKNAVLAGLELEADEYAVYYAFNLAMAFGGEVEEGKLFGEDRLAGKHSRRSRAIAEVSYVITAMYAVFDVGSRWIASHDDSLYVHPTVRLYLALYQLGRLSPRYRSLARNSASISYSRVNRYLMSARGKSVTGLPWPNSIYLGMGSVFDRMMQDRVAVALSKLQEARAFLHPGRVAVRD